MKKLNILKCGDQNFWAYYWIAKEQERYSKHNIIYAKHDEINIDNIDVLYIHSPDITNYHASDLPLEAKKKGIPVIGAYAGNPLYWSAKEQKTYSYADIILTISPQTYSYGKFHYTNIPTIYMPECIDTKFFTPKKFDSDSFVVGWAGGRHKKIKRYYIADALNFNILYKDNWKEQRQSQNKNLDLKGMRDYYKSIDVLIVTSESECQPRVVMEAMATGLPVVATNVGSMKMLIDEEWIVPVNPDIKVINQLDEKLLLLKNSPYIRKSVGEKNQAYIHDIFSWEKNQGMWDKFFENIYEEKIDKCIEDSENFLRFFGNIFTSEFLDLKLKK